MAKLPISVQFDEEANYKRILTAIGNLRSEAIAVALFENPTYRKSDNRCD